MVRVLLMCMPDIYQPWHAFHIKGPWIGGASIAGNCPGHKVYVADLVLKRSNIRKAIKEAIDLTDPQIIGLSRRAASRSGPMGIVQTTPQANSAQR